MQALIMASLETPFLQSEVQELSNSLSKARYTVQILQVNVSTLELYRVLSMGAIGLVWVASHVDAKGFRFGDIVITPRELGLWMRQARTRDAVLNTCHSIQHVSELQRQANVNIVATINPEIVDQDAWTYALYLSKKLAETASLQAAYRDTVGQGASEYRWFPAPRISEDRMTGDNPSDMEELQRAVEKLEYSMSRLVRALQGDQDSMMRSKGLIEMVQDLEKRVTLIEGKVDGSKLILTRWGAAFVVLFFVALALGLMFLVNKLGGGPVAIVQLNSLPFDLSLLLTNGY